MRGKVLAEAAALLPVVHAMQQLLPFKRWRRVLEQHDLPPQKHGARPSIEDIRWAVHVGRRWVPGEYKCLPSAYVTHILLHRHGYDSMIHVGVARDPAGKVEAHAWVLCDGQIVMGGLPDLSRFSAFPPLRSVAK